MRYFLELFFGGLTRGGIYALIALGYTMVYGIIGLINFAHGEIYMLGAFVGLVAAAALGGLGLPGAAVLALVLLAAVAFCAGFGVSVERIAYRPLRGAGRLSPLISAIGMSIFLQNVVMLAQTPDFVAFPDLIARVTGEGRIFGIFGAPDACIVAVAGLLMAGLTLFIRRTRLGKAMRATAQNQVMARLVGVDVDRVVSATFAVGSGLAAVGGVLVASHAGQINFFIGFTAGLKAFTAAVLGGIGSIPGAMLGGLVLGFAESFGAGYVQSDYEDAIAFGLLVLILVLRPQGILGRAAAQKA
jgi:branched-chain amino acid transport system permease protein